MLDETIQAWPAELTVWYEQLTEDFAVPVINEYEIEECLDAS